MRPLPRTVTASAFPETQSPQESTQTKEEQKRVCKPLVFLVFDLYSDPCLTSFVTKSDLFKVLELCPLFKEMGMKWNQLTLSKKTKIPEALTGSKDKTKFQITFWRIKMLWRVNLTPSPTQVNKENVFSLCLPWKHSSVPCLDPVLQGKGWHQDKRLEGKKKRESGWTST